MRPLGLYIHIPFCLRKCAYCNFVSYPDMETHFDHYIKAVLSEARLHAQWADDRVVDTVFIGGGTPSLLDIAQLETLMSGLQDLFDWQPTEFTIEANPETLTEDKIRAYAELGINRISIGLQTHDDDMLSRIGRCHTFAAFEKAYTLASRCFNNINIDTIFSLPGQSTDSYLETIRRVIDLAPQHVSSYALKIEEGTPLAQSFAGADEDDDRAMCHGAAELLGSAGYAHYETSNFAMPGFECRHNLKYWTGGEYIGLGVAAHSYIDQCGLRRLGNVKDLERYIEMAEQGKRPLALETAISDNDRQIEYIMLRLRLKGGISFDDYRLLFGTNFESTFFDEISRTKKAGLITLDASGIYPTQKGYDLQNMLIGEFIKKL